MPSVMQAAVVLLMLIVASAAEDRISLSLRGSRSLSEVVENATQSEEMNSHSAASGVNDGELLASVLATPLPMPNQIALSEGNVSVSEDALEPHVLLRSGGGWYQGGDKMWGSGTGVESINSSNVGYYDQGMDAAQARCGGADCALIVNPPGHRTVDTFHIHFVHYASYGTNLKHGLETLVCGKGGWHNGTLPCFGKAAYFPGFPGIFSEAMTGGSIQHASVIAWPESCGGAGTIVELAYRCSIEHQIRGDYDPSYR